MIPHRRLAKLSALNTGPATRLRRNL